MIPAGLCTEFFVPGQNLPPLCEEDRRLKRRCSCAGDSRRRHAAVRFAAEDAFVDRRHVSIPEPPRPIRLMGMYASPQTLTTRGTPRAPPWPALEACDLPSRFGWLEAMSSCQDGGCLLCFVCRLSSKSIMRHAALLVGMGSQEVQDALQRRWNAERSPTCPTADSLIHALLRSCISHCVEELPSGRWACTCHALPGTFNKRSDAIAAFVTYAFGSKALPCVRRACPALRQASGSLRLSTTACQTLYAAMRDRGTLHLLLDHLEPVTAKLRAAC